MKATLLFQAVTKFLLGLAMIGLLLFLPAGTLDFPKGWLFCGLLFLPMLVLGIVLYLKAPELLRKRLARGAAAGAAAFSEEAFGEKVLALYEARRAAKARRGGAV